jgi:hypothetical protein
MEESKETFNIVNNLDTFYQAINKIEREPRTNGKEEEYIRYYLTIPVRLYYNIVTLIALLEAKEKDDPLTKEEREWLYKFKRHHMSKEIPLAGLDIPILMCFKSNKITKGSTEPVNIRRPKEGLTDQKRIRTDEAGLTPEHHARLIFDPIETFGTQLKELTYELTHSHEEYELSKPIGSTEMVKALEIEIERCQIAQETSEEEVSLTKKCTSIESPGSESKLDTMIYRWMKNQTDVPPKNWPNANSTAEFLNELGTSKGCQQWFTNRYNTAMEHADK